jgi:hypothetical protein
MKLNKTREKDLVKIVNAMNIQDLFDTLATRGKTITRLKRVFALNGKTHSAHAIDLVIQIKTLKRNFYKKHPKL